MPLFFKTWRLLMIISTIQTLNIRDCELVFYVILCLFIDLIILGVFTVIDPKYVGLKNDEIQTVNELQDDQYQHEICARVDGVLTTSYLTIVSVWKCLELIFGIYCALSLSSMGLRQIQKFNETTSQIIGIFFTVFICIVCFIIIEFEDSKDYTQYYVIAASVVLLIGNVVLGVNVISRLAVVVCNGDVSKYSKTQHDLFKDEFARNHHRGKLKDFYRSSMHELSPGIRTKKIGEEQVSIIQLTPIRKMPPIQADNKDGRRTKVKQDGTDCNRSEENDDEIVNNNNENERMTWMQKMGATGSKGKDKGWAKLKRD